MDCESYGADDTRSTAAPGMPQRLWPAAGAAASVALAAVIVFTSLGFVWESHFVGPFRDFWYFIAMLVDLEQGAPAWGRWTRPFGAHRVMVGSLWNLLEVKLFAAQNVFLLVSNVVVQAMLPLAVVRSVMQERVPAQRELIAFVAGIAFAVMFSATQITNLILPWQITYVTCSTAACLSFVCLSKLHRASATQRPGLWLTCSVLAAVISSFSMGAGVLAFPVLLGMCFLIGAPRRAVISLLLVGAVVAATYLGVAEAKAGERSLSSVGAWGVWVLSCLGMPLTETDFRAGAFVGGLGIAIALCAGVVALLRRDRTSAAEAVAAALVAFGLGSVLLIGLGRFEAFPDLWNSPRYQLPALTFWLGLILLVNLQLLWKGRVTILRHGPMWVAVLLWIGCVMLPAHFAEARFYLQRAERVRDANVALMLGVESYGVILPRFRTYDFARPLVAYQKRHRIGAFAAGHHELLGKRIENLFAAAPASACRGSIERHQRSGAANRLNGRGIDVATGSAFELVVFSGRGGTILGLGLPTERRAPWKGLLSEPGRADAWVGYTARPFGGAFDVWGVLSDGRACRFARARRSTGPAL